MGLEQVVYHILKLLAIKVAKIIRGFQFCHGHLH